MLQVCWHLGSVASASLAALFWRSPAPALSPARGAAGSMDVRLPGMMRQSLVATEPSRSGGGPAMTPDADAEREAKVALRVLRDGLGLKLLRLADMLVAWAEGGRDPFAAFAAADLSAAGDIRALDGEAAFSFAFEGRRLTVLTSRSPADDGDGADLFDVTLATDRPVLRLVGVARARGGGLDTPGLRVSGFCPGDWIADLQAIDAQIARWRAAGAGMA
jgi:hypothetical protein